MTYVISVLGSMCQHGSHRSHCLLSLIANSSLYISLISLVPFFLKMLENDNDSYLGEDIDELASIQSEDFPEGILLSEKREDSEKESVPASIEDSDSKFYMI